MTVAYAGPERRSLADRRVAQRRTGDRFAADAWRYSGQPNRRNGRDRRSGVDRRQLPHRVDPSTTEAEVTAEVDDLAAVVDRVLEQRQVQVVYQPIYELKTGRVFAYEALARTNAPEFTNLLDLFRAASEVGRVGDLGRLHRSQAVASCPRQPLFLNIFPTEFDYGLLVRPDDAIYRHRHTIYLEITESIPLSHFDQCHQVLGEVRKKGIKVAIDDLGAGYSNLKYISDLAPEIVKLDRNLITGVREGLRQAKLVRVMVELCKNMGARVVAEGIETIDELIVAERAGADFCQGFLLGKPRPSPEAGSWPAFR